MTTEFQERIREYVERCPNQMAGVYTVAANVFPERWKRRAARGAMTGHVRRAAEVCSGLIFLPGRDRWDPGTVVYHYEVKIIGEV